MLRNTLYEFLDDQCMLIAAALAFYTALSFAPALILVIWGSSYLGPETQTQVVSQITAISGESAGEVARIVLNNAEDRPELGSIAGALAIGGLLISATSLFAQVQEAMNLVWNVKQKEGASVVKGLLRKRFFSFLMLLFILLVLLAAMVTSATLITVFGGPEQGSGLIWEVVNAVISVVVFTITVAVIFKFLPDVIIGWRSVWVGALITGVLLVLGKFLTGLYLSTGALGSAYGAGGTLFVLLIWVYYSWSIVLLGAEFTQVWARKYAYEIRPHHRAVAFQR